VNVSELRAGRKAIALVGATLIDGNDGAAVKDQGKTFSLLVIFDKLRVI
jgi:hypothetical protein